MIFLFIVCSRSSKICDIIGKFAHPALQLFCLGIGILTLGESDVTVPDDAGDRYVICSCVIQECSDRVARSVAKKFNLAAVFCAAFSILSFSRLTAWCVMVTGRIAS